jgi:histidyl-tRNA synthetase
MSSTFQSPPGTRDFYPETMAVRRYIEDVWRRVSIRHGFLEVDGPTFEFLDLYKVKSGEGIVSELFHFETRADKHGHADQLALRPEFTPTLGRMVTARANGLPKPIRWFSIPRCYRAERPQKGRLREFFQWNADVLGDSSPQADLDCMALCVDALREFGLTANDFRVGWNNRNWMTQGLLHWFVPADRISQAYAILDKLHKLSDTERHALCASLGCSPAEIAGFDQLALAAQQGATDPALQNAIIDRFGPEVAGEIRRFNQWLADRGMGDFAHFDFSVVRGLAYYTGFVFEVFDRVGDNRALAGGGRYDQLIELFNGPSLPATGFGMGDVVLEIVLREHDKMPEHLLPRPAVFVINALETPDEAQRILADLRQSSWADGKIVRPGLHVITSSKTTKNVGKLLQDASASGAALAVIVAPDEHARGAVKLKNLADRTESEIALADLRSAIDGLIDAKKL